MRHDFCVYCGSAENLTVEHFPAKLLFPEPRPSDLLTVRACRTCNEAGSKDAEYFRLSLCFNPLTSRLPSVVALRPALRRSLGRPQGSGFHKAMVDATKIIGPDTGTYEVDIRRLHEVIQRTACCVYLHETGERLPTGHSIQVIDLESVMKCNEADRQHFIQEAVVPLEQQPTRMAAGGQFSYSLMRTGDPHRAICEMTLYDTLTYFAFIGDVE
jgi:hypothetical protein